MKNRLKLIAALFILSLLLSACGTNGNNNNGAAEADNSYTSKEIADAIMAAYAQTDLPESGFEYFFSGADENSDNYIDAMFAGFLINGAYAPLDEFKYFSDCAFYIPVGRHIFEIDVLKSQDGKKENLKILKEVLTKRLDRKNSSDVLDYNSQEKPLLDSAEVITAGNYAFLLATTDNSKAEKVIKDMITEAAN